MSGLSAERITVTISGAVVVRRVSIEVAPGEVLGVFGPSGAGKSTLFRAIAGEQAAEGAVRLAGEDISRLPLFERARRGLGYLPQTPSVLWDLTVEENLAAFAALTKQPRSRAEALLDELGLAGRERVPVASISGGERRRLEIARAMIAEPRVLVCDEPFAAVDPIGAARIGESLRALAGRGAAVLLADHHVAEALRACDRCVLLLHGEVALTSTPAEMRAHPLVKAHYVDLDRAAQ